MPIYLLKAVQNYLEVGKLFFKNHTLKGKEI